MPSNKNVYLPNIRIYESFINILKSLAVNDPTENIKLVKEIKTLIEKSKKQVAVSVNVTLALLYWKVGKKINHEILRNRKPEYGKEIVLTLSMKLTETYGSGWSQRHLFYCIRFADVFNDEKILHTLCAKLT